MGGRQTYLGEFEQVVMLAVVRLGADAYGTQIRREIEARGERAVSIGAAYATLDRLVDKGYLRCRESNGGAERGGDLAASLASARPVVYGTGRLVSRTVTATKEGIG